MYRMLIIDDEPAIVKGLVQLFSECEMELDVWEATSAYEVMDIIQQVKVDLVLSDIRMPEINGLQLIDEILFYWPSSKVIFLTGYSEFEYAYAAFQKNVENYILKHEDDATLLAAVQAVVDKLDAEMKNEALLEQALKETAYVQPLIKKQFLEALLLGEPLQELLSREPFCSLTFRIRTDLPVILLSGFVTKWGEGNKLHAYHSIQRIFTTAMTSLLAAEELLFDNSALVWLIQPNPDSQRLTLPDRTPDWKAAAAYLKGMLESVQNSCQATLGVDVSFMISGTALSWNEVHQELEKMKSWIGKNDGLTPTMTIVDMGSLHRKEQVQGEHALIEKIHRFIDERLGEDLSLIKMADVAFMNPSYFSRYYKQQTGRNVSEYIQSSRLKEAKAMLADSRWKVQDIAQRLGFASPSYFAIFFKKMTGLTPQEFRERL